MVERTLDWLHRFSITMWGPADYQQAQSMPNTVTYKKIDQLIHDLTRVSQSASAAVEFRDTYQFLLSQRNASEPRDIVNEYLRFVISCFAIRYFGNTRELTEVHTWIVRGLSDDYETIQKQYVHVERIFDFTEDPCICAYGNFRQLLITWLDMFYYYCAEQAALDDFGTYYLPLAYRLLRPVPFSRYDEPKAFLLSRIMTWTVQTNHAGAQMFTEWNEGLALEKAAPPSCRAVAVCGLVSRRGTLSKHPASHWASYALIYLHASLDSAAMLQMLQVGWNGQPGKRSKKILTELRKQRKQLDKEARTPQHLRLLEDGRSELLKPTLVKGLEQGNVTFAHEAIRIWYAIDREVSVDLSKVVWHMPSYGHGLLIAYGSQVFKLPRDTQGELVRLTSAANRFLGTSVSVRDTPSETLHIPDRPGVPTHDIADDFKDALASSYLPPEAIDFLRNHHDGIDCQLIMPSKPHPIQALQLAVLGTTWPLSASFRKPLPDAPIRRVAIWAIGGLMGQNYELVLARNIFVGSGIAVDIFAGDEENGTTFLDVYKNPEYDVVWLISHGEYDHFSPKNSTLALGQEKTLAMQELLQHKVQRNHRRLLVLNVCDGATHAGEGVLPHIGFAAALAGPGQATISHKWPVAALPAAAFGALLALRLCRQDPYFVAYKNTILQMMAGGDDGQNIASDLLEVSTESSDFLDRLRYSQNHINAFAHYGSAAFFE